MASRTWAPSVLTFVSWKIAFTIFIFALKTFDLSLACAIWVGSGKCDRGHHRNPALKNPQILSKIVSIHLVAISVTGFWCERSDLMIERPLMPCDSTAPLPLLQPGPSGIGCLTERIILYGGTSDERDGT